MFEFVINLGVVIVLRGGSAVDKLMASVGGVEEALAWLSMHSTALQAAAAACDEKPKVVIGRVFGSSLIH